MMILRWLTSKTVRQGVFLHRRVKGVMKEQEDLLKAPVLAQLVEACAVYHKALAGGTKAEIEAATSVFTKDADKLLRPYEFPEVRENVDVFLVALVVAMGIRTFFLSPMAIPTGSMQPTLYGITHENLRGNTSEVFPSIPAGLFQAVFFGVRHYHIIAQEDGEFRGFEPVAGPMGMLRQRFVVGSKTYTVWFPPDQMFGEANRSGLRVGQSFKKGEDIIKLRVKAGDRLFADRVSYNFRNPHAGDIVIFESTGIPRLTQNTHYIKRLIATGGQTVRIGNDRHAIVDGIRFDASTPHFENIYAFNPKEPPHDSRYSGHVNDAIGTNYMQMPPGAAPLLSNFADETTEFKVREGHLFVMGDNTMNSYDSRYWRDFPQEKLAGRHCFVFWPFTERFGWGVR